MGLYARHLIFGGNGMGGWPMVCMVYKFRLRCEVCLCLKLVGGWFIQPAQ
nr:hypothetical protein Iba_chr02aCG4980 [Ipomoea batatas]GMC59780.1 hypothetical protein Iba_chr02bCG4550 [Ipomoea batatas]GMC63951.1 hypothetical protein Iba_chr02dCG0250 [Ipomoea batatas]GMC67675.1 hypothetical protein Iba_chr02fCG4630 [Ipomoea batatas]GME11622.1 hypothetical protein Iba_scaffold12013CG0020 [Ipomoea batatas]